MSFWKAALLAFSIVPGAMLLMFVIVAATDGVFAARRAIRDITGIPLTREVSVYWTTIKDGESPARQIGDIVHDHIDVIRMRQPPRRYRITRIEYGPPRFSGGEVWRSVDYYGVRSREHEVNWDYRTKEQMEREG